MKRLFFISALLLPIFLYAQTSAETWVARGMGYDNGNRYDSSTVCYRKALALDSLNVEAGWRLAAALYKLDSTRAAIDLCQSVIEIDRKCKDVYFVLGSIFFDQGSYKSAEEYLRRATEFGGPSYVQAWCRLGESYLHLSDTAQAERCWVRLPVFADSIRRRSSTTVRRCVNSRSIPKHSSLWRTAILLLPT